MATSLRSRPLVLIAFCVAGLLVIVGVAIGIWQGTIKDDVTDDVENKFGIDESISYNINSRNISLTFKGLSSASGTNDLQMALAIGSNSHSQSQSINVNTTDHWSSRGHISFVWSDGTTLDLMKSRDESSFSCLTFNWTMPVEATETPLDCVDSANVFWYGGLEESYQPWPMNNISLPLAPFVTGDAYGQREIGNVIEPLFVSSYGFGIYFEETVPLYISFNHEIPGHFCFKGQTGVDTPYFQKEYVPHLAYHVCRSHDVTNVWKQLSKLFISKPQGIPSPQVFRYPIWSTWARYKGFIDQNKTLEFANNILGQRFGISQLEIDDNWTPKYGDFTFDTKKFPDASGMISKLTALGIPVTVWIHPFFNNDSMAFNELSKLGYLIKSKDELFTAITAWWRGQHAGILDVSNPKAVEWYLKKMSHLKSQFNVTSFKFDAGEVNWLPKEYSTSNQMSSPNYYSHLFAKMAYRADTMFKRQETRVGFKTQELPVLVRMIDRDSIWGHERGLKSLIPTALTFSMMGYPFILPDMIGGNAYDPSDLDKTVLPEAELFVRWLQVTTFMPTLQFSVAPWEYNETIVNISRKFVDMHESISSRIISLARHCVDTGEPIVRPIWWIAPNDQDALRLDSEFLLGDEILVAPVLEQGATSRDVYFPEGCWRHEESDVIYCGPKWHKDFPSPLDELPHFFRL